MFVIFQRLKDNSGFGWDPVKKVPTADDAVWDAYLEVYCQTKPMMRKFDICFSLNPKAKILQNASLPFFEELSFLFADNVRQMQELCRHHKLALLL